MKWLGVGVMGFGALWLVIGGGIMLAGGSPDAAAGTGRIFAWMGLSILVVGLLAFAAGLLLDRARRGLAARIDAQGISATATISRVEPNWNVRVNGRPIYTIVEFAFTDSGGAPRQVRKTRLSADLVAGSRIAPGSQVEVRYLMDDPRRCGLVLTDESSGLSTLAV